LLETIMARENQEGETIAREKRKEKRTKTLEG
jgi:hypothetical protein